MKPDVYTILIERCQTLLATNQVTTSGFRYTKPAPHVYEHQWMWDSCFHAIVYRWYDPHMAAEELISVIQHQIDDGADAGMIPLLTYWQGDGTSLWGIRKHSTITQPPLISVAAWAVYQQSGDIQLLDQLYPALVKYHAWFARRRDPDGDGLVTIIHPWESGWDASPRWDSALGLCNPTDAESQQVRHHMVRDLSTYQCDVHRVLEAHAFAVESVDFNAIRAADLEALAHIASALGKRKQATYHLAQAAQVQMAVRAKLWNGWRGIDLFGAAERVGVEESAGQFFMLFGGCATAQQAAALLAQLHSGGYATNYAVPTTPTTSPLFDGDRYWRGNVWLVVNWLIYRGLRRYGYVHEARTLAQKSCQLVMRAGFHEYFNPQSGEGFGAAHQSWSAIILDMIKTEQLEHTG